MTDVSIPRQNPVDELLHRGREVVGIKGIGLEIERGVAREHQILLDVAAVGNVLERFLDAEAARIGEVAGRIIPAIGTGGSTFNLQKADIIAQSPIDIQLRIHKPFDPAFRNIRKLGRRHFEKIHGKGDRLSVKVSA